MGIEIMNTEILSTAELEDAAHYARACQAKYEDIQHRTRKQGLVVRECSDCLGELVNERAWEKAATPEEAREARQACAEAAEQYEEEHRLLRAMDTAAINAREETTRAGRKVYGLIGEIVTTQLGGGDIRALIEEGTVIDNIASA